MTDYSDTAPLLEWLRHPRWMEGAKQKRLFDAADEIERLQTENWQLRQACGYPIPADKETPQNPFKCGICDARHRS